MGTGVNIDMNTGRTDTKRQWIFAKKPAGKLYKYRQYLGYSLLLFLILGPFLKIGGEPFLLFNIITRKFSIFGQLFYPQDLHIFVFGMLITMVFIVLFTVVYGRVWCGWTCPQTIFMELLFRRIEYWIEGDWKQQQKARTGVSKNVLTAKRLLKHVLFFFLSFFISNIFLAYIIGLEELYRIMSDPISQHWGGLAAILLFTLVFYAVFAHVREIVCTTICPYGRLQGVLMDDQTKTVTYDYRRGEPRGKSPKNNDSSQMGDCIDCHLCVGVCPTGIDIRKGMQMECVSCTACIDECDAVMDKIGRPTRLIGFYTAEEIEGKVKANNNLRGIGYSLVLFALMAVFGFMIFSRSIIGATLLRAKGSTYQFREDHMISNLYTLELSNKSGKELPFTLTVSDSTIHIEVVNKITQLSQDGHATLSFFLLMHKDQVRHYKTDLKVFVFSGDKKVKTLKTTFIAPPGM